MQHSSGHLVSQQFFGKEWNNAICSNMDEPKDYHIKWSKPDRERHTYDIAYMWNLKKKKRTDTNELIHNTETDS